MSADTRLPLDGAPRSRVLALLLILASSVAGCGGRSASTTAPDVGSDFASPFTGAEDLIPAPGASREGMLSPLRRYPLAIGNRWDYVLHSRVVTIPNEGEPSVWRESVPWSVEVVGTSSQGPHEYFQLSESDPRASAPFLTLRQRQDADGWYELEPVALGPDAAGAVTRAALGGWMRQRTGAARRAAFERAATAAVEKLARMRRDFAAPLAPTAAEANELTFLRFPVRTGQSWIVRDSPRFTRLVVGHDELELRVGRVRAWRVRGFSELYGPGDRVFWWYGRAGLVRARLHAEVDAVDETGAVIGRAVVEFEQSLARVRLQGSLRTTL